MSTSSGTGRYSESMEAAWGTAGTRPEQVAKVRMRCGSEMSEMLVRVSRAVVLALAVGSIGGCVSDGGVSGTGGIAGSGGTVGTGGAGGCVLGCGGAGGVASGSIDHGGAASNQVSIRSERSCLEMRYQVW